MERINFVESGFRKLMLCTIFLNYFLLLFPPRLLVPMRELSEPGEIAVRAWMITSTRTHTLMSAEDNLCCSCEDVACITALLRFTSLYH